MTSLLAAISTGLEGLRFVIKHWRWLLAGALVSVVTIAIGGAYYKGHADARRDADIGALENAIERNQERDGNNANFNRMSDRDKCLSLTRPSGLSDRICD